MGKFTAKEIQYHVRQEVSRKTPIDENRAREARELDNFHKEWLAKATWREVEQRISVLGLFPGSEGYERARAAWTEYQRDLQKKIKGR